MIDPVYFVGKAKKVEISNDKTTILKGEGNDNKI